MLFVWLHKFLQLDNSWNQNHKIPILPKHRWCSGETFTSVLYFRYQNYRNVYSQAVVETTCRSFWNNVVRASANETILRKLESANHHRAVMLELLNLQTYNFSAPIRIDFWRIGIWRLFLPTSSWKILSSGLFYFLFHELSFRWQFPIKFFLHVVPVVVGGCEMKKLSRAGFGFVRNKLVRCCVFPYFTSSIYVRNWRKLEVHS